MAEKVCDPRALPDVQLYGEGFPWQSGGNVRADDERTAIKRILFITLLTILGGLVLAVSLTLAGYVLLSFYAAGR